MKSQPIAEPDWDRLKPDLRDALRDIALRAAWPFGVTLQSSIDGHLSVFCAAIRDGASHRDLARLLHEAGVAGRDGSAPSVGSVSRALNRARAKYEANAGTDVLHPKSTKVPVDAKSSATGDSDEIHPRRPKPGIRSAIERGAARLPIPPPADVPHAVSTETPMAAALRRGHLLNELKAKRSQS